MCETNRFIVIDFETAKENELRALRFPTVFPGYPDTAHRFREILRLWEENNMLVCRSRIYALLSTFHGTTSADQRIAGIISVMKQQLGNPDLSLRELCHSFGLSPSHLRRLFHQQTGLSPHQYLEELRITQAKHMLANGEGDAFVSAGNTGALLAGATLIVRRIKGVHRAAIGTVLPFPVPVLLLDSGANVEVDENTLLQFAVMGSAYMEKIYALPRARVGLLNNGTEPTKGTELYKSAYQVLSASELIDFVGNVEGKTIAFDTCDVLVCDGFTGNILLKSVEGMGKFFMSTLKSVFSKNLLTKASALAMRGKLKAFKKQFDASEHGGAPLLGISKPVIKAHGSSDARAVMNAVRQAVAYIDTGIIYDIAAHTGSLLKKTEEKPENTPEESHT